MTTRMRKCTGPGQWALLTTLLLCWGCALTPGPVRTPSPASVLDLPVVDIRDTYLPYQDFCERKPGECDLGGVAEIELTSDQWMVMMEINAEVNRQVVFRLDKAQYDREEFWAYPLKGFGDCEDMALEKRARMVRAGFPRGALRMAIGYHKKWLSSHALLTIETRQGTYVMDSISDRILLWHRAPYNFETRERPDGRWERYDQDAWHH